MIEMYDIGMSISMKNILPIYSLQSVPQIITNGAFLKPWDYLLLLYSLEFRSTSMQIVDK